MQNKTELQHVSQQITITGPLPAAGEFEKYERTLNGAANRILTMAEKEAEYRHKLDETSLNLFSRGQIFAFVLSLLSIGAVGMSIAFEQPVAAIAPTITAITGLAAVFFNRK